MRQAAINVASRGWSWTWIVTILGTLACTTLVGWYNGATGGAGSLLIAAALAGALLFVLANTLRLMLAARERRAIAASTDPLTGLFHRRAFMAAAEAYLTGLRHSGRPGNGALLVIDIDDLKGINDAIGYEAANGAIIAVAHTLRASSRRTDLIGRLGGDEFGILLIGADRVQSQMVAYRLCHAVESTRVTIEDVAQPLAISVGIALFRETTTLPDLINAADRALYAAKQNGGNRNAVSPVEARKLRVAA